MGEWYYALGNQQKGPVSLETLQRLASMGKLQRTDMVWREGMPQWKPASQVAGVFAEVEVPSVRRRAADEDEDDDDRPPRRKKRRKETSPGAMAAIIGSSVGGGILILIVVIVLLVRTGRGNNNVVNPAGGAPVAQAPGGGPAPPGWQPITYTVTLREGGQNKRIVNLQQGQRVEILVKTGGGILHNPDVDLFVTRIGDGDFTLSDQDFSKDCYLQFIAPATDQYIVEVENLGPGSATSTVTIR